MRSKWPRHTIIAGNVVTNEMTEELILHGADIVKVACALLSAGLLAGVLPLARASADIIATVNVDVGGGIVVREGGRLIIGDPDAAPVADAVEPSPSPSPSPPMEPPSPPLMPPPSSPVQVDPPACDSVTYGLSGAGYQLSDDILVKSGGQVPDADTGVL